MIVQFFVFTQGLPSFSECGRKRAGLSIYPFLSIGTKKSPDAGIMGGQCPEIFGYSYEKPELLYEYPGKLPDVYFNFSAFFP